MPAVRRIGISYSRFSAPKQSKGDSQDRQDRLFADFCARHNLTPLAEIFADRGRSGYRDEHRKKGRLGQLIALAKDGRFEPGTVIVVEAWDRLGRLRPDRQTELVAELLRTGLCIGVCRLEDLFSEEDFGTHKWTTLAVFIQLAYQESKQKAERVASSWQARRDRARRGEGGRLITARLPFWLEDGGGLARPVPERVAALKRIFTLSAGGFGKARIIRQLIAENVPPFGTARWTAPYVDKILNDRRVLGEYQPRKTDDTPDGPAIRGYYPQVITEGEYRLARDGQAGRRGKARLRDRRHVNAFRSLLSHARDGEGFFLHNHGTTEAPQLVLVNAAGMGGRAKTATFPYPVFEEAILSLLCEVDPRDVLPPEKESASRQGALRAELKRVRQDLAGLQDELRAGFSKTLAALAREKEAEEVRVGDALQEELARFERPAARAWKDLPSLAALVREGGNPARLKLRLVLRRVVEAVWLLTVRRGSRILCAAQVFFPGGSRRDYLVLYQAKGRNRPGGWWARSLASAVQPNDLDLRRRHDAARLEKALLAMNLDLADPA
jgi:DNA invertase Pin-like site-specific DNA recombinase